MTPVARLIAERIRETGPITVADYMAECLLHPVHGYYTTRDPFGTRGDFTTAPEISQMFGELLGLALAQAWLDRGSSTRFTLAELGPGRGTLMADILRVPKLRTALGPYPALQAYTDRILTRPAFLKARQDQLDHFAAADAARAKA